MELKRILARDTRTATEQAIRLYGEDVLIVSNHRVGQQTELVLAVDIAAEPQPQAAQPQALAPQPQDFRGQLDGLLGHARAATPAEAAATTRARGVSP